MLGRLEALTQHDEILFAHRGLSAKARDQRLLAVLSIIQIVDGALLGGDLGAQPQLSSSSSGAADDVVYAVKHLAADLHRSDALSSVARLPTTRSAVDVGEVF